MSLSLWPMLNRLKSIEQYVENSPLDHHHHRRQITCNDINGLDQITLLSVTHCLYGVSSIQLRSGL